VHSLETILLPIAYQLQSCRLLTAPLFSGSTWELGHVNVSLRFWSCRELLAQLHQALFHLALCDLNVRCFLVLFDTSFIRWSSFDCIVLIPEKGTPWTWLHLRRPQFEEHVSKWTIYSPPPPRVSTDLSSLALESR
jgi:hypothetical protein